MEYICMICGSRQHVLREGQVMLCTRCITALGIALGDKLEALHGTPHRHTEGRTAPHTVILSEAQAESKDLKGCSP